MRLLVTGATGQLGTDVVAAALARGHDVHGTDLPALDLTDAVSVRELLESVRPEAVVHTAAFTRVDECEDRPDLARAVNAGATRHVAEAAERVGAHLVHVSTDYVFDGTKPAPYTEDDEPCPVSVYGASKLEAELAVGPAATVARTSWLCGRHGPNIVRTVLRLAAERPTLRFVTDQVGRPTFAADLAPRLVVLAEERVPGIVHTTNGRAVSWWEFAREVMDSAGLDPERVEPVTTAELDPPPRARRPANSELDDPVWRALGLGPVRDHREPLDELVAQLLGDGPSGAAGGRG